MRISYISYGEWVSGARTRALRWDLGSALQCEKGLGFNSKGTRVGLWFKRDPSGRVGLCSDVMGGPRWVGKGGGCLVWLGALGRGRVWGDDEVGADAPARWHDDEVGADAPSWVALAVAALDG